MIDRRFGHAELGQGPRQTQPTSELLERNRRILAMESAGDDAVRLGSEGQVLGQRVWQQDRVRLGVR
jgi:hypothetical protein